MGLKQRLSQKLQHLMDQVENQINTPYVLVHGCCSMEVENATSSTYDWRRLGFASPAKNIEDADVLIVGGWIHESFSEQMKSVYSQMRGKKSVIAIGACALSGAPYAKSGEKVIPVTDVLPVDVFVPGCPPRPEAILEAIQSVKKLQKPQKDHKAMLYEALRIRGN